ncbi:hypothetical protein BHE74_00017655 [Ensete ventricosum]|nr:hypothetical protein BHE74_00017655 [Ensete ventricosum]
MVGFRCVRKKKEDKADSWGDLYRGSASLELYRGSLLQSAAQRAASSLKCTIPLSSLFLADDAPKGSTSVASPSSPRPHHDRIERNDRIAWKMMIYHSVTLIRSTLSSSANGDCLLPLSLYASVLSL